MKATLSELQGLIGDLSSRAKESDLLLMQLDADDAHRLRLCAIPHTFDSEVLSALDPGLNAQQAEEAIEEFRRLPAVIPFAGCLTLHDVVRQQLFEQWLSPERHEEFSAASARLVQLYRKRPEDSAVEDAAKRVSRLFHLLGADRDEGFRKFQADYRTRRDRGRLGDCEALLRLLQEYEPSLDDEKRDWLTYYRGEVADDNRNLAGAYDYLEALLARVPSSGLRCLALLRSESVLRRLGRLDQAKARCDEALKIAGRFETGPGPSLIHHELGLIARDQSHYETARVELERSAELAKAAGSHRDILITYNSLGTLMLKPLPREALKFFQECLSLLDPEQDKLQIAMILNNLGLASANIQLWQASEEYYARSLQIKREAHDLYGEASTLLNVSRVYRAVQKWDEARSALMESSRLFEQVHDMAHAGQALRELARLTRSRGAENATELYAARAIKCFLRANREQEAEGVRTEFGIGAVKKSNWRWVTLLVLGLLVTSTVVVLIVFATDK